MKSETNRQSCACKSLEKVQVGAANAKECTCGRDCSCGTDRACATAEACSRSCSCTG